MKKAMIFTVMALAVIISLASPQASWAAELTIGSGSGAPGETVILPMNITSGAGEEIAAVQFDISFVPSQLSLNGITAGPAAAGKILAGPVEVPPSGSGIWRAFIYDLNNQIIPDGVLVNLSFTIQPAASSGDAAVSFLPDGTLASSAVGSIPITAIGGQITISGGTVKHPPEITSGPTAAPAVIAEDQTAQLSVTATDPDDDILTYNWSATGGSITGSGANVVYNPPDVSADTDYTITVVVSDGNGGTDSAAVVITVQPLAEATTATLKLDDTVTAAAGEADVLVNLNLSTVPAPAVYALETQVFYDPSQLNFKSVAIGPVGQAAGNGVSFLEPVAGQINLAIYGGLTAITDGVAAELYFDVAETAAQAEEISLTLAASKCSAGPAQDYADIPVANIGGKITISGTVNHPPEITSGPTADSSTIFDNATTIISLTATDPDGDSLTYSWSADGGNINGTGAQVTYEPPTVDTDTAYTITVEASDGRGGVDSGSVAVTVQPHIDYTVQLSLDDDIVAAQSQTDVLVNLELSTLPGPQVTALGLDILYSANELAFKSVSLGSSAQADGKTIAASQPDTGILRLIIYGGLNPIADSTVAQIYFDVKLDAAEGDTILSLANIDAADINYNQPASISATNGKIHIELFSTRQPMVTSTNPASGSLVTTLDTLDIFLDDDIGIDYVTSANTITATKDGAAFTGYSSAISDRITLNIVPDGDGVYAFTITPWDNEVPALSGIPATITLTLDTTPPSNGSIQINGGNAYTNETQVNLALSAQDPGSGVAEMQLSNDGINYDDLEVYQITRSWSLSAGDGVKSVFVQFQDGAGNTSAAVSDDILLDQSEPVITFTNPAVGDTTTSVADFTVEGDIAETGSGISWVRISLNGGLDQEAVLSGSQFSYHLTLQEGRNTITVSCQDNAGNSADPEITEINLDTTGPSLNISSPVNGSCINDAAPQLIYATDGTVTVLLLDDAPLVIPASGDELAALLDGAHTLSMTAVDGLDNLTTRVVNFTVDTIAPVVIITSPLDGSCINTDTVTLLGAVDGVAFSELRDLPVEGGNTLIKEAADLAGNTSFAAISVIRDTIAPVVIITSPADGSYTNLLDVTLEGTVDGTAFSEARILSVRNNENILSKAVTDSAGNTGTASIRVIHDDIDPVIVITSPADGAYTNQLTVNLIGTVDGAAFSDSKALTIEGVNTLTKDATDLAGNSASRSITVIRDTIAPIQPTASIITPLARGYTKEATISLKGNKEANSSIQINGQEKLSADSASLTWEATFAIQEGDNSLNVTSRDRAGNESTPAALSVKLKTIVVFNVIQPTKHYFKDDDLIAGTKDIMVMFTIDDEAEIRSKRVSLTEGENTVTLTATDFLGNVGSHNLNPVLDTTADLSISITSHQDNQELTEPAISLSGNVTGAATGLKYVRVNAQNASVSGNAFNASLTLTEGANTIFIQAEDNVGYSATASITLNYIAPAEPAEEESEEESEEEAEEETSRTSAGVGTIIAPIYVPTGSSTTEEERTLDITEQEPGREITSYTKEGSAAVVDRPAPIIERASEDYFPRERDTYSSASSYPETTTPKVAFRDEAGPDKLRLSQLETAQRPAKEIEKVKPPKIEVRLVKRFLFWRLYQMELEGEDKPLFWKLQEPKKLPFLLKLNTKQGSIYGIVWGKKTEDLNVVIITQDRDRIEASCKLEIE